MMDMKPGDMLLFDSTHQNEVLEDLSRRGYRFYHGGSLAVSLTGDKFGIRYSCKYSFPNCLATMSLRMSQEAQERGTCEGEDGWNIFFYNGCSVWCLHEPLVDIEDLL